jgi:hypothetical protein
VKEVTVNLEFLITALVVVASPGTGVLYTLAAGLARGASADDVDAPDVRRRICRARREAGAGPRPSSTSVTAARSTTPIFMRN